MSWATALKAAAALGGAAAGFFGSRSRNKQIPQVPEFRPYSGYRPPHVEFLRPVEKQITDILMRRSLGQDVGFDPSRLSLLKETYDIGDKQRSEREDADIMNELSGTGLSRNLAAREALLGRARTERGRERNKYFNLFDVEDLERRSQEREAATGALQNLNAFNFGQENRVADFDFDVYNAEEAGRRGEFSNKLSAFQEYESPLGAAFETGLSTLGGVGGFNQSRAITDWLKKQTPPTVSPTRSSASFVDPSLSPSAGRFRDYSSLSPISRSLRRYNLGGR